MKIRVDLPHALFLCTIAGWTIWYFLDARAASGDIQNLGLIAPAALIVVVLCAIGLAETIHFSREPASKLSGRDPLPWPFARRILGAMSLLGVYVLTMDRVGFDIATWAYILANLAFLGERRIWMLIVVPLAFTAAAVFAFGTVLQTPIPLLFGNCG